MPLAFNGLLAAAITPSTPQGALDRVRIQKIVVVPDGALPLHGGLPTNDPDTNDHSIDMEWGWPGPPDPTSPAYNPNNVDSILNVDRGAIHELNHARYLVDSYGLNVAGDEISVSDPSTGGRLFPNNAGIVHTVGMGGQLMGGAVPTPGYGEWEANWLNVYARRRPLPGWGNFNASASMSQYMTLNPAFPADNVLHVVGLDGLPLANATVKIYQADPWTGPSRWYGKSIDDVPDRVLVTDAAGNVSLGAQPFKPAALIGWSNFPLFEDFIRVEAEGQFSDSWLDLSDVNVHFFRGETQQALYEVRARIVNGVPDPTNLALSRPAAASSSAALRAS